MFFGDLVNRCSHPGGSWATSHWAAAAARGTHASSSSIISFQCTRSGACTSCQSSAQHSCSASGTGRAESLALNTACGRRSSDLQAPAARPGAYGSTACSARHCCLSCSTNSCRRDTPLLAAGAPRRWPSVSTLHLPSCVATCCWCCSCTCKSKMSALTTAMHLWPVATAMQS